jgi:hypothetical protein
MSKPISEVPYGTLDLLILKTLDTLGPAHGYRISRRIEQVSEDALRRSQGSVYPALVRLELEGRIRPRWGMLLGARITLGLAGALAMTRVIASPLFEVSALDPVALAAACVATAAVGLTAGLLPARRASRVQPMTVLREQG